MLKAALTGNIGCGKTTVGRIFEFLGVPVYNADDHARRFLFSDNVGKKLTKTFGKVILDEQGFVDKIKLADLVFNDSQSLGKLNAIIHPLVMNDFSDWARQFESQAYVILESAIIFENKLEDFFDRIILITAPEEERIMRVMKRECVTREKVMERIKNQLPEKYKEGRSAYIINNDNNTLVIPQVLDVHSALSDISPD